MRAEIEARVEAVHADLGGQFENDQLLVKTALACDWRGSVFDFRHAGLHGVAETLVTQQSRYAFNYPIHSGLLGWQAYWNGAATIPYAVRDASLARTRGRWRPFVQFTNLTSMRYEEIAGVAMPTRAVLGDIK